MSLLVTLAVMPCICQVTMATGIEQLVAVLLGLEVASSLHNLHAVLYEAFWENHV